MNLRGLAAEMGRNINKAVSATPLSGVNTNADMMQNYRKFIEFQRTNHFEVEDYYLQKNMIPLASKQSMQ